MYLITPFQLHTLHKVECNDDCEQWIGENVERSGRELFQDAMPEFACEVR